VERGRACGLAGPNYTSADRELWNSNHGDAVQGDCGSGASWSALSVRPRFFVKVLRSARPIQLPPRAITPLSWKGVDSGPRNGAVVVYHVRDAARGTVVGQGSIA
jgi:hypothetical protein